MLTKGNIG